MKELQRFGDTPRDRSRSSPRSGRWRRDRDKDRNSDRNSGRNRDHIDKNHRKIEIVVGGDLTTTVTFKS